MGDNGEIRDQFYVDHPSQSWIIRDCHPHEALNRDNRYGQL